MGGGRATCEERVAEIKLRFERGGQTPRVEFALFSLVGTSEYRTFSVHFFFNSLLIIYYGENIYTRWHRTI